MNDDQINELLRRTREEAELPSSFQREVWRRIAHGTARQDARWSWLNGMLDWLAKPLPAAAAWSLALLAGLFIGTFKPQPPGSAARVVAYAQSINPLAKVPAR